MRPRRKPAYTLNGIYVVGLAKSEGAKIFWPPILVVGSPNSSPGPSLGPGQQKNRLQTPQFHSLPPVNEAHLPSS
jgi:hypothetical protein